MDYYLFDRNAYDRIYNCSVLSPAEWEKRKEPNPIGAFYLILATIYQVLYIPFLAVMLRKDFWVHSCYKLMFLLGVVDVIETFVGGTLMGILTLRGDIFCTSQDLIYLFSCSNSTCWPIACVTGLLLGFNRFLDLLNKEQASKVFDGRKTYYWMLLPLLIGGYFTLYPRPFLLNSKLGSLFNNPFAAEPDIIVNPKDYENDADIILNSIVVVFFPSLYAMICITLFIKTREGNSASVSSIQKQIIIQAIIISAFLEITCVMFVYMQFFYLPPVMIVFIHFVWQTSHGASVFVYIFVNKSMRKEVFYMIRNIRRKKVITIQVVPARNVQSLPMTLPTS